MKKTVPLTKEIKFDTNIAEVTSIALDHDLSKEGNEVIGTLVVSGSYKMNDVSINVEEFKHNIPVNIELSDHYDSSKMLIEIDDFYYEIIDSKGLNVNIEIGLNNLFEKELIERKIEVLEEVEEIEEIKEFEEKKEERMEISEVKTLFDSFDESVETYSTYKVYIIKENDNIESIMLNYNVSKDILEQYNDLSDLKIGDKIIIPNVLDDKD